MWSWLKAELNAVFRSGGLSRFALDLSEQKVSLIERTAGGPRLRDAAAHQADDFELQLERIRKRVAGRGAEAPVDILLPSELTLARVETFPAEARRNLRDEAWWRLESITPYRPEELCYDVALLGVEPVTGFLDVSVALAPRDIVEEAVDYAKRWGFAPQRVGSAAPIAGFPQGPLFHQAADLLAETRSLRRGAVGLAVATLILAVAGVTRGVAARDAQLAHVADVTVAAEADLALAMKARQETLDLAARALKPSLRRRSRSYAVNWLETLAIVLPPETVVDRLTVNGGEVRVEGAAANVEAVIAALEGSQTFSGARVAAAPVPIRDGPRRMRFAIEANLSQILTPEIEEAAMSLKPDPEAGAGAEDAAEGAAEDLFETEGRR